MFTGLVEEIGTVVSLTKKTTQGGKVGWVLVVKASTVLEGVKLGDSIAVNGTCLTVFKFTSDTFTVGCAPETMRKTNLGDLKPGDGVNLERSLSVGAKMGGHFVQGHVDTTGVITQLRTEGDSLWVTVRLDDSELMKSVVPKGFISVDGTSLTVCEVGENWFNFMLIAYTQTKIVIARKRVGQRVNLETDILAKYTQKIIGHAKL